MKRRIIGFDAARALAIIGMVIVNFEVVLGAEANGPHWVLKVSQLFQGRAAALFVVLAGVGMSLLSNKARRAGNYALLHQKRNDLLKRALFLFVMGFLYTPIWPADILHFYGIYITIGALMLKASNRSLWFLTSVMILGFVLMMFTLNYERGWDFETLAYEGFWTPAGMARNLFFNGFHPVFPWTAFLLFGMILGRLNLLNAVIRKRTMAWGLGITIIAETISWLLVGPLSTGVSQIGQETIVAIFGTGPMPPMPLYLFAGAGAATFVITICVDLGDRYREATWVQPFVSAGQLALTIYVAHVILGMGMLEAMGRLENQSPAFAMTSALVFLILSVIFAHAWHRYFPRGPLETVMRKLTNRKSISQTSLNVN